MEALRTGHQIDAARRRILRQQLQAMRQMPQVPTAFNGSSGKDPAMEQDTPTIIRDGKIDQPGVVIKWRDKRPYVEVWQGSSLLLAGWVYESADYTAPMTIPLIPSSMPVKNDCFMPGIQFPSEAAASEPLNVWSE
jgi:hypothetical protein